jgi:zinc/manganese transport system substrate-binding protein
MTAIRRIAAAFAMIVACAPAAADDAGIGIIAAENVYGDIARQIGGNRVTVLSILNNPDQDPHLFESTPATIRKIADARIVIANGANYDPWMDKLLDATPRPQRAVMSVAAIVGRTAGENPHLWYDPATIPAVAKALAGLLGRVDSTHRAEYEMRLQTFLASLVPLEQKIADMRARYAGVPVTATEPVFSYMADAVGLTLRNERFQMAVMNDTEPAARDLAAFEDDLKNAKVDVLLYNRQVSGRLADQLIDVARKAKVPVVGVTETEPANTGYVAWMLDELQDLERALQNTSKRPGGGLH